MNHSLDEEVIDRSHSNSCGQWLIVQVKSSDEWCLQGSDFSTIFVGDMARGFKCTLRKFVDDSKLCGVVVMPEGRVARGTLTGLRGGSVSS